MTGALLRDYPECKALSVQMWDLLIEAALATARHHATVMPAPRALLFELAGYLKGVLQPVWKDREDWEPTSLEELGYLVSPVALAYMRQLRSDPNVALPGGYIDWDDDDAVRLAFEKAWDLRKTTISGFHLSAALSWSEGNHLRIQGNRHVVRIVNIAYFLAVRQPELPFLLPVTDTLAKGMGITRVTLATAIRAALKRDYIRLESEYYSVGNGIARKFSFNFEHPEIRTSGDLL